VTAASRRGFELPVFSPLASSGNLAMGGSQRQQCRQDFVSGPGQMLHGELDLREPGSLPLDILVISCVAIAVIAWCFVQLKIEAREPTRFLLQRMIKPRRSDAAKNQ